MTRTELQQAMESLRRMCDPRGHQLLDAIEDALIGYHDVGLLFRAEVGYEQDTLDHSKAAELRVVPDAEPPRADPRLVSYVSGDR